MTPFGSGKLEVPGHDSFSGRKHPCFPVPPKGTVTDLITSRVCQNVSLRERKTEMKVPGHDSLRGRKHPCFPVPDKGTVSILFENFVIFVSHPYLCLGFVNYRKGIE
jgi:hypothetical protein